MNLDTMTNLNLNTMMVRGQLRGGRAPRNSWPTSRRKNTEEFVANFEEEEHRGIRGQLRGGRAPRNCCGGSPTTRPTARVMALKRPPMARPRGHQQHGQHSSLWSRKGGQWLDVVATDDAANRSSLWRWKRTGNGSVLRPTPTVPARGRGAESRAPMAR